VTAIQQRARLNSDIQSALQRAIAAEGKSPVLITSVQISNIDFSDAYEKAIEQRMLAEVEVERLRQNLEREKVQAEIAVTQAKGRADAVRAEAQAQADAIRLRGDAEAAAIKARGGALGENPKLVDLVQAERWDGKLPATMVPGSSVPMLALPR
jgi:regulator of protease activity HflC (stomatin/prohibitin superfamily)